MVHKKFTAQEHTSAAIRDGDRQQLRILLLAGAKSAPAEPANAAYFEALRKRIIRSKKTN